jgi:hypothetical protein
MILPVSIGGTPFEGVVLVVIALSLLGWMIVGFVGPASYSQWFLRALSLVFLALLGLQEKEAVKVFILVILIFAALELAVLVAQGELTSMRFIENIVPALIIVGLYFLIDTQYDTVVWIWLVSGILSFFNDVFVETSRLRSAQLKRIVKSGKNIEKNGESLKLLNEVEKLQKESESLLEQYEKKAITFDDLESRFEKVQSKHKELKDRIALEELTVNR